jgi:Ca2+-binding EF-hand superfamily protein/rhodanese-related sulfurtransferase
MDRTQKLRYSFDALDGDGNGALDFDELVFVCRKINPGKGVEEARSQLAWMDKDGDGQVDQDEYVTAMLEIMQDVDEETFVSGVRRVLTAIKFAKADRLEKLKMVFERVDEDDSGELDRDELTKLAVALVPGGDEVKVRKTMKWLDANGDAAVSFEEFKGPMIEATEGLDDDQFDAAVHKLLAAEGEAIEPDPADDLPPKFGAYVTQFPSHSRCKWMSVKRVDSMTKDEKKICVVDCRAPEERAVSMIKDSVPLGDVKFVSFEDNNVDQVAGGADVTAACEGADVIVCVSAVGAEGGLAAPVLAEKLEGKYEVRNLVGGIVAWYNAGGEVVDEGGVPVEAVHPGQRRCIGFVRPRKNSFKFPKEEK